MSGKVSMSAMYAQLGINVQGKRSLAYLCGNGHGRTNRWARHKPERDSAKQPLTEARRGENNFALLPTNTYGSVEALAGHLADGTDDDWTYESPRRDSDRMRLSDFDGYDHGAASPMWLLPESMERTIPENGTLDLRLTLTMPAATAGAIRLKDMRMPGMAFGNWYPGAVMFDDFDTVTKVVTSDKTVTEQGGNIVLDFGNVDEYYAGVYTAVPVIASKAIPLDNVPDGITIIQMSGSATLSLHRQEASYSMSVKATRTTDGTTVNASVTVTCKNTTAAEHVFPGVLVKIAKDGQGTGAVTIKSFGDITVAAGQSKTVSATVNLTAVFGTSASLYSYFKATSTSAQVKESVWTPSILNSGGFTPVDPVTPGTVL